MMAWGDILRNRKLLSALFTLAYSIFIVPVNEALTFSLPLQQRHQFVFAALLKASFAVALYFLCFYGIGFISQLWKKDKFYLRWLKLSAFYFALNIPLFLLIYPGYWVWDELYINHNAQTYSLDAWQHIFTNIYHTFCLYLIPTGVGVVLIQLLFASLVVGYIISKIQGLLSRPRFAYLLFIPFLLIPVLVNNLYPLRMTAYSYIEILLLFKLLLLFLNIDKSREKPYETFFWLSVMLVILSFWRSEGFYYLLLIPAVGFKLSLFTRHSYKHFTSYAPGVAILFMIIVSFIATKYTFDPKYQLTTSASTLSVLIHQVGNEPKLQKDFASIDKVVDLKFFKKYPDPYQPTALWAAGDLKPGYKTYVGEYNRAYLDIVLHHPVKFFKVRFQNFLATNSLVTYAAPHIDGGQRFAIKDNVEYATAFADFYKHNLFSKPLNEKLKLTVTRLLIMTEGYSKVVQPYAALTWTVLPTLVMLLVLFVVTIIRREYVWCIAVTLLLTRTVLIFLTAPANNFFYYLPVYMSGNFVILFYILLRWRIKESFTKRPLTR